MTFLTKKTYTAPAYYPRQFRESTVNSSDRLHLVYNLYFDERPGKSSGKKDPSKLINLYFSHGTGFCKEGWEFYIERFFEDYGDKIGTVIATDSVDHNDSNLVNRGKLGTVQTWADAGRDIVYLLTQLDLPGSTIVIGHSMGASASLYAAAYAGHLIDSVITFDPVVHATIGTDGVPDKFDANVHLKPGHQYMFSLFAGGIVNGFPDKFKSLEEYDTFMKKKNFSKRFDKRCLQNIIDHTYTTNEDGSINVKTDNTRLLIAYLGSVYNNTELDFLLKAIKCEVCHVVGDKSTWNPPYLTGYVRKTIENVVPVDISEGRHLMVYELPQQTYDGIKPFFEKRYNRLQEKADDVEVKGSFADREQLIKQKFEKLLKEMSEDKFILASRL